MGSVQDKKLYLNDRRLSVVVSSLFASWMLSLIFEGQIMYSLAATYDTTPHKMIFGALAANFAGLLLCGFFIKTLKSAKRLMLSSYACCILISCVFFFPPSLQWMVAIIVASFLAGGCVAAWGFFFKSCTPKNERIRTAADMLILSNILMILLNMAAIHLSPRIGLVLSILMLLAAFLFALRLSTGSSGTDVLNYSKLPESTVNNMKPFSLLYLFILVITINSGLMYQVLNPAYAHLEWLTSWYWAVPYIVALFIMRNVPRKTDRTYILYVAIAMMGFSFIAFMSLDRSPASYLLVNTLMLGACGVFDLFWWSILGEMLSLYKNPAMVLGMGLSANVLGVLLGGLIGNAISSGDMQTSQSTLLAMAVVCVTLILLPLLHKHLSLLLNNHAYLTAFAEKLPEEQGEMMDCFAVMEKLTGRESEVVALLMKGKTYKAIANELYISENTVKTHVKNIYSKLEIQSRSELIALILGKRKI